MLCMLHWLRQEVWVSLFGDDPSYTDVRYLDTTTEKRLSDGK